MFQLTNLFLFFTISPFPCILSFTFYLFHIYLYYNPYRLSRCLEKAALYIKLTNGKSNINLLISQPLLLPISKPLIFQPLLIPHLKPSISKSLLIPFLKLSIMSPQPSIPPLKTRKGKKKRIKYKLRVKEKQKKKSRYTHTYYSTKKGWLKGGKSTKSLDTILKKDLIKIHNLEKVIEFNNVTLCKLQLSIQKKIHTYKDSNAKVNTSFSTTSKESTAPDILQCIDALSSDIKPSNMLEKKLPTSNKNQPLNGLSQDVSLKSIIAYPPSMISHITQPP